MAFQSNAFQNNAFQIGSGSSVFGGVGLAGACGRAKISFGNRVLNTGINYVVDSIDDRSTPNIEYDVYQFIVREGAGVGGGPRFAPKPITVKGRVIAGTPQTRQRLIDRLANDLTNGIQILRVGAPDERYYLARLQGQLKTEFDIEVYQETVYEAVFLATDPFAYHGQVWTIQDNDALVFFSGTSYRKTVVVTPGGNIYSRPVITIEIPLTGPYGLTSIQIINATAGPVTGMTITKAWVAGDVLEIDSHNFTVRVNGIDVDYAGTFILLDPRAGRTNDIEVYGVATSVPTLNFTAIYRPRWQT